MLRLVLLLLALAAPAAAETVTLTRADGASFAARLAGDWGPGCPPTLILSHGLGGDERALGWMDGAAAAAGFRVLVMEHRESGPRALLRLRRGSSEALLRSPAIWRGRALDLDAAIAFASRDCRPRPLVLGGHSMGAALTMFEAGARGTTPYRGEDRFDAYLAVSPQGPSWAFAGRNAWSGVGKPVLMLTGTRDDGPDGTPWQNRLVAFAGLPAGEKRLAIIAGATHFHLGGRGNPAAQSLAAAVAAEFLGQLRTGWAPSSLDRRGLEIREK
jgi:alpha-beta hydrolase superfamily lysophospholipase